VPSPLGLVFRVLANPAGRRVVVFTFRVARSEEGRELIRRARRVAASGEARRLLKQARQVGQRMRKSAQKSGRGRASAATRWLPAYVFQAVRSKHGRKLIAEATKFSSSPGVRQLRRQARQLVNRIGSQSSTSRHRFGLGKK